MPVKAAERLSAASMHWTGISVPKAVLNADRHLRPPIAP